jgi:hypothetical protein
MNSEKLVKSTVKLIAKITNLDYEKLKNDTKKIVKMAKNYDQEVLGMMEEMLDLSNVSSEEELVDFNLTVLQVFCRVKELDIDGLSEKHVRRIVWQYMEEEMMDDDDSEDEEDDDFIDDDESEDEEDEEEEEVIEIPVKQKRGKKEVTVKIPTVNPEPEPEQVAQPETEVVEVEKPTKKSSKKNKVLIVE